MFKFLFGRKQKYAVYYTMSPGTFVLKTFVEADSEYKANRKFDQEAPAEARRLPGKTELVL